MTVARKIERLPPDRSLLRLLATSDLHAELRGYDYNLRRPVPDRGIDRASILIERLRREADCSVLVDNGDFLFGEVGHATGARCEVVSAMNAMGYDAAALGNHEHDHGPEVLEAAIRQAHFPVLCSNIRDAEGKPSRVSAHIATRHPVIEGQRRVCRIGIAAILPPSVIGHDGILPDTGERVLNPGEALAPVVAGLRAEGADLIVVLCHEGLIDGCPSPDIRAVLAATEIDALVMGHRHGIFPREGAAETERSVLGVPAVMPGHLASHVGCIDLTLGWRDGRVHVIDRDARCLPVASLGAAQTIPDDPFALREVTRAGRTALRAALRAGVRIVGHSEVPLASHFVRIGHCAATRLVARSLRRSVEAAIAGTPDADIPVVGLAAPGASGGHGGAWNFVSIPAGPISDRDLVRLRRHDDAIVGILGTGHDLRLWLERSVSALNRVREGQFLVDLVDPRFPAQDFDLPDRVTFAVDLTRPAAFDRRGVRIARPERVRDLHLDGEPLDLDRPLMLAITGHRAGGGAGFPLAKGARRIESHDTTMQALARIVVRGGDTPPPQAFGFLAVPNAEAVLATGPAAEDWVPRIRRGLSVLGTRPDGFLQVLVELGAGLETGLHRR